MADAWEAPDSEEEEEKVPDERDGIDKEQLNIRIGTRPNIRIFK